MSSARELRASKPFYRPELEWLHLCRMAHSSIIRCSFADFRGIPLSDESSRELVDTGIRWALLTQSRGSGGSRAGGRRRNADPGASRRAGPNSAGVRRFDAASRAQAREAVRQLFGRSRRRGASNVGRLAGGASANGPCGSESLDGAGPWIEPASGSKRPSAIGSATTPRADHERGASRKLRPRVTNPTAVGDSVAGARSWRPDAKASKLVVGVPASTLGNASDAGLLTIR